MKQLTIININKQAVDKTADADKQAALDAAAAEAAATEAAAAGNST